MEENYAKTCEKMLKLNILVYWNFRFRLKFWLNMKVTMRENPCKLILSANEPGT